MTDEFFLTQMGRRYYEVTLPQMLREVGRLADSVAALNQTLQARPRARSPSAPVQPPAPVAGTRLRVLVVDDDERVLRGTKRTLEKGHDVLTATSAEAALAILDTQEVDVVLTDHGMPGGDGLWLLEQVRDRYPRVRRILTSGQPPELDLHIGSGLVQTFVPKPAPSEELVASLRTATLAPSDGTGAAKRCVKCGAVIDEPNWPVHQLRWAFWFTGAPRQPLGASRFWASVRGRLRARPAQRPSPPPAPETRRAAGGGLFAPDRALSGPLRGESSQRAVHR